MPDQWSMIYITGGMHREKKKERFLIPSSRLIKKIKQALSIPVMAKTRVGHFVEAQILESIGSDYIDESETLAVAGEDHFINKQNFGAAFVCDYRDLGEALRRIKAPYDIVAQTKQMGRLPVVHFAAGGIVTPADAALVMQLGCDGVFLGPEVFFTVVKVCEV
ncbi:pyridoxal biosynthesis lyase PdxS [Striga asiatica]|uniref:Pyridoxal biosynthesis lyase PdxS n=1 Tax=Striga asiatica TaxID=4170 RepID=A0A5A7PUD9_STRAF|nr:pyridoxal biosynthesis lyase PdxS [Striga asiatica]